jgi:hypothetical protein
MTTPQISDTRAQTRVLGQNYTTFQYAGLSIAYLEVIGDGGQAPVGRTEFIHPLGYDHPIDIVAPRVIDGGTLTLGIREIWHYEVWEHLSGLAGTHNIIEVFQRLRNTPNYVTCAKIITPPDGKRYGKVYHRCLITNVPDGEEITIDKMSEQKPLTIAYTHTTPL